MIAKLRHMWRMVQRARGRNTVNIRKMSVTAGHFFEMFLFVCSPKVESRSQISTSAGRAVSKPLGCTRHVRSHTQVPGNELADRLAEYGHEPMGSIALLLPGVPVGRLVAESE